MLGTIEMKSFLLNRILLWNPATRAGLCILFLMFTRCTVRAWQASLSVRPFHRSQRLWVYTDREADFVEEMIGGERYEMSQLPDSMMDTTLFVGNLNEFVQDEDLSELFQSVSSLQSVPACVVRKADTSSLRYGFVSFPTVEEKEAAILNFDGFEWRGKRLKVEKIRDQPGIARVKVPERMVTYVSGASKKRGGNRNGLRRISRDDVERLSRGQPSKKKGYGSRNVPHRLDASERAEMERAAKKGYVTLAGMGNRRTRKGSPLANIHRQWCDARAKPQILLYKAVAGRRLDQLVIDLSPLRLLGLFDDPKQVGEFFIKWKTEIMTAAVNHGMDTREGEESEAEGELEEEDSIEYSVTLDEASQDEWATSPIWKLPVISMGVFVGERSNAKSMARELAILWDIPEKEKEASGGPKNRRAAGARKGGKDKMKGLSQHRKRGGGHRQSFY